MTNLLSSIRKHKGLYLVNVVVGIFFLLPFLWIISTSLKTPSNIAQYPPKWIPDQVTFANYKEIFMTDNGIFVSFFTQIVLH
ncbi:ABC transporter permease family protein [Radiobacillus deserti]|uniref:hypothetical protein n=1 Tax=Radiobacillus deserti TaxID=2594883 RepID=UPI001E517AFB|nr:hypothetical protein [Radiobacillus deserti]